MDAACPLSTRGETRLVRLVRGRGGGGPAWRWRRARPRPRPPPRGGCGAGGTRGCSRATARGTSPPRPRAAPGPHHAGVRGGAGRARPSGVDGGWEDSVCGQGFRLRTKVCRRAATRDSVEATAVEGGGRSGTWEAMCSGRPRSGAARRRRRCSDCSSQSPASACVTRAAAMRWHACEATSTIPASAWSECSFTSGGTCAQRINCAVSAAARRRGVAGQWLGLCGADTAARPARPSSHEGRRARRGAAGAYGVRDAACPLSTRGGRDLSS
jgi:hypothetical protein